MAEQQAQFNKPGGHLSAASASHPKRRTRWHSSIDALTYIYELAKKPEVQTRHSDRITGVSVLVASAATVLCLLLHRLNGVNLEIMILCDFFLGVSLIMYVFNRLGIITALTPRQAVLTWQLIQSFTFVGVFITVNVIIILSTLLALVPLSNFHLH